MPEQSWTIGKLAKRTGLTVRALHHYDRIGLLSPSRHTEGGHRLYTPDDLVKLQQIVSLKQLGFRLGEIKAILHDPEFDPAEMLRLQLTRLEEQMQAMLELRERLRGLYDHVREGKSAGGERFLVAIRMMNMAKSPLFSAEQIRALRKKYFAEGHDEDKQAELRRLLGAFRRSRESGKTPDDPDVLALARRWREETEALALADPLLIQSAERYYRENPDDGLMFGVDGDLYRFMRKALSLIGTMPAAEPGTSGQETADRTS